MIRRVFIINIDHILLSNISIIAAQWRSWKFVDLALSSITPVVSEMR